MPDLDNSGLQEIGVYIKRFGKKGDIKHDWGYYSFFGNEQFENLSKYFNQVIVKNFDNYFTINEVSEEGNERLIGIESLVDFNEADSRAYQKIKEMATGTFVHLKLDTKIFIIDKTGNKELLETQVKRNRLHGLC
jgi:hypothetical protein